MRIDRQIFLAGAAMSFIARQVHEAFKALSADEQDFILTRCKEKSGVIFGKAELLDRQQAIAAIDRALEAAFAAWRKDATEDTRKLMDDEELSVAAQWVILEHLPFVPSEHGNPEFVDAVARCAPYYLSYGL